MRGLYVPNEESVFEHLLIFSNYDLVVTTVPDSPDSPNHHLYLQPLV